MTETQLALLDLGLMMLQRGQSFPASTIGPTLMKIIEQFYRDEWPHFEIIARRIIIDAIVRRGYLTEPAS